MATTAESKNDGFLVFTAYMQIILGATFLGFGMFSNIYGLIHEKD